MQSVKIKKTLYIFLKFCLYQKCIHLTGDMKFQHVGSCDKTVLSEVVNFIISLQITNIHVRIVSTKIFKCYSSIHLRICIPTIYNRFYCKKQKKTGWISL